MFLCQPTIRWAPYCSHVLAPHLLCGHRPYKLFYLFACFVSTDNLLLCYNNPGCVPTSPKTILTKSVPPSSQSVTLRAIPRPQRLWTQSLSACFVGCKALQRGKEVVRHPRPAAGRPSKRVKKASRESPKARRGTPQGLAVPPGARPGWTATPPHPPSSGQTFAPTIPT
jgi:hypothetical protein